LSLTGFGGSSRQNPPSSVIGKRAAETRVANGDTFNAREFEFERVEILGGVALPERAASRNSRASKWKMMQEFRNSSRICFRSDLWNLTDRLPWPAP
jgi:hypothetical protein